jgi:hypothetical protein
MLTYAEQVALAAVGDAVEAEAESCLDIFFGYVRRGIANEVLRAVRRCPNLCCPILTYLHLPYPHLSSPILTYPHLSSPMLT